MAWDGMPHMLFIRGGMRGLGWNEVHTKSTDSFHLNRVRGRVRVRVGVGVRVSLTHSFMNAPTIYRHAWL